MIDWIKGLMLQSSMKALVECNRIATSTDFRPELARIGLPTLVIHGDKDSSAPLDLTGRRTAHLIPDARISTKARVMDYSSPIWSA
jgi:pimeloyl-ACP methyl ester carboxylesterase